LLLLLLPQHGIVRAFQKKIDSEPQIENLVQQAKTLVEQGMTIQDVVHFFEHNLIQEALNATPSDDSGQIVLLALVFLFIGGGATYLVMNEKLKEKDVEIARLKRSLIFDLRF
jgi:hypothetical protein